MHDDLSNALDECPAADPAPPPSMSKGEFRAAVREGIRQALAEELDYARRAMAREAAPAHSEEQA